MSLGLECLLAGLCLIKAYLLGRLGNLVHRSCRCRLGKSLRLIEVEEMGLGIQGEKMKLVRRGWLVGSLL